MKVKDSVVVMTGASSGIGRATALELASRGATVVLGARDRQALDEVAAECRQRGGQAVAVTVDVTRDQEVQQLARSAVAEFGRIDVWINGAAVGLFARFDLAPPDLYRRVIETNLFGYVNGARAALRQFRKQEHGILINIDSVTGGAPQPYTSAYVASKFAVRGWSACLRMELSLDHLEDRIHVCNVMPATIDTPFFQHAANYTGRAVKALGRPVYAPERVAAAVASLIEKPRREIVVGNAGRLILAQAERTPRVYEKAFARVVDRSHFQERTAAPTEGNLFRSTGPKDVKGGWALPGGHRAAALAGAAVALIAAAVAVRKLRE